MTSITRTISAAAVEGRAAFPTGRAASIAVALSAAFFCFIGQAFLLCNLSCGHTKYDAQVDMSDNFHYLGNNIDKRDERTKDLEHKDHNNRGNNITHDVGPLLSFVLFSISCNKKVCNETRHAAFRIPIKIAISAATTKMVWIANATSRTTRTTFHADGPQQKQ